MVIYLGIINTSHKNRDRMKLKYRKSRLKIEEKKSMRALFDFQAFLEQCGGPILKISFRF